MPSTIELSKLFGVRGLGCSTINVFMLFLTRNFCASDKKSLCTEEETD